MELLLIRHGQIAGDPHKHYQTPVSGCLSPKGMQQAARLAQSLGDLVITRVYASPLGRALQTAQSVAGPRDLTIQICPFLEEWRPAEVLQQRHRHALGHGHNQVNYAPSIQPTIVDQEYRPEVAWKTPLGEGTYEMAARLIPPFLEILQENGINPAHGGYLLDDPEDSSRIAIVAHGGTLGMLTAFLLGLPLRPFSPISFEETGVARLRFNRHIDVWYPSLIIPAPCTDSER
jgi:broad specificity phosphatase PhoE